MKNTIIKISTVFSLAFMAGSCGSFTDIVPKGANMLETVSDIDMVLNHRFTNGIYHHRQAMWLLNDLHPAMSKAYSIINEPETSPTRTAIYTWDASIDRVTATETDVMYTDLYSVIGKVCNPVILRADVVKGDRAIAARLKAEALILRAWHHYLLVNLYAKAYNPATAAEDGGIPYSSETDLPSVPNAKRSVREVYDLMLEDIDNALASKSLGEPSPNRMRVNSAFAHAVKAKVLMSMRDYDGAYQAAASALEIENTVDDYNTMLKYVPQLAQFSLSRPEMSSREDLFFAGNVYLLYLGITPEFAASFEPGNILNKHADKQSGMGPIYFGVPHMDLRFDPDVYLNGGGLSTVDMYLLQAECLIRKGDAANIASGMDIINVIRRHRVATEVYAAAVGGHNIIDKIAPSDYYSPWKAANQTEAIARLKQMVRAECWYGPKRFMDMKRWNTETAWQETLVKHIDAINGNEIVPYDFTLSPDSPLWIFPFPSKSTSMNPNLTQNY